MTKIKLPPTPESRSIVVERKSLDLDELLNAPDKATIMREMTMNDFIKQMISTQKVQQKELADKLGMKSQSGVIQALQRDMRMSMVLRFLGALDCELIVKHNGDEVAIVD